jgi:hypothetical protein
MDILNKPEHPANPAVKNLLVKTIPSEMTREEIAQVPDAFRVILNDHPTAMGLFLAATKERAPGQSPVQHHYEIFSTAALVEKPHTTQSGKTLSIDNLDRLDFGMKMAADYTQPKRFGTIEADMLVTKKGFLGLVDEKTVGIDAKYSKTGDYSAKKTELERQIEGIRKGFGDGKLDEFVFVTNRGFSPKFKEMVDEVNLKIVIEVIREKNIQLHEIPRELLTAEEKENQPSTPIPENIIKDKDAMSQLVSKYHISQIDLCEHVKFRDL